MKKLTLVIGDLFLGLACALFVPIHIWSDKPPPIPKEVKTINTAQLKKMFDGREKFPLVDSRIGRKYQEGHILTAELGDIAEALNAFVAKMDGVMRSIGRDTYVEG